jgi:hypothetical protein
MKMQRFKEIAKFLAGLTAWESIVHLSLAASGNLPISFWGITITESCNTVQIIVPALCSIILIYFAWIKK